MDKFADMGNSPMLTAEERLERRYKNSPTGFLVITLFSLLNLILLLTGTEKYFLFSACIPYLLGDYGMYYSGKYPPEYYADAGDVSFFGNGAFAALALGAAACILFYFLCWIFAKRGRAVWLVTGFGFFALDTIVMLTVSGLSLMMLTDTVIHIWLLVSLWQGVFACQKLKTRGVPAFKKAGLRVSELSEVSAEAPSETAEAPDTFSEILSAEHSDAQPAAGDSPVLRAADSDSSGKVFVRAEVRGLEIVYRRARRFNELIVNGNVYAEYEVLTESEHTLTAVVGGHRIEAVYDGSMTCRIIVDGKVAAKKIRLI